MFDSLGPINDQLVDLKLIADKKPFFLYDLTKIQSKQLQIKSLMESVLGKPVSLSFSLKTQPNYKFVEAIRQSGISLDVSSLNELDYALAMGFENKKIFLGGVGLTDQAIEKGLITNIGGLHLNSIDLFNSTFSSAFSSIFNNAEILKKKTFSTTNLSIRFHPEYLKGSKIGETKERLIAEFKNRGILNGLHVYIGRESFEESLVTKLFQDIDDLQEAGIFKPDWTLFFGPGLPDLEQNPLPVFKIKTSAAKIKIEAGRSLASSCGYYGAPILSVKDFSAGKKTVIIDGGLQHFGSPWVTLRQGPIAMNGLFLDSSGRKKSNAMESVAIYGSLCLWHDCLHPNFQVPKDLRRGDWIIIPHMGSYGLTAGVPLFIGEVLPKEFYFDGHKITDVTHKKFGEMTEK